MKKVFCFLLVLASMICKAQNGLNIVPMPAEVKMGKGNCILSDKFIIRYDSEFGEEIQNAKYLQKELKSRNLNCQLRTLRGISHGEPSITLINFKIN